MDLNVIFGAVWDLVKIVGLLLLLTTLMACISVVLQSTHYEWKKRRAVESAKLEPIHMTAKMLAVRAMIDELRKYAPEARPSHELSPYEDVTLLEEIAWLKALDSLMDYEYDYKTLRKEIGERIVVLHTRRLNLVDKAIQP